MNNSTKQDATKLIDLISKSLVGKKVKHKNSHYRDVVLAVESVKIEHHHMQITPDTQANDWWGQSSEWDTTMVTFTDGSSVEFNLGDEINIVE